MPDPKLVMTDAELLSIAIDAFMKADGSFSESIRAVIARIRRPLEARGIGLAAHQLFRMSCVDSNGMFANKNVLAQELEALARQHAAGEDGK